MNVRAAHFTVILSAGSAGIRAIAEIDQAAKRDKGKQDGLLLVQPYAHCLRMFLQNGSLSHGLQPITTSSRKNRLRKTSL